jgi:hypothetical protein
MNPNAAKKGKSFKGVAAYIIHDPDRAKTTERVLFTDTRNLRTDDPEKAAKVMAYTAAHASFLKQAAGVKAGGRKSENPVYHFSSVLGARRAANPSRDDAGRQNRL